MPHPHYLVHNNVDHSPLITDIGGNYTTSELDDTLKITGDVTITLHTPQYTRYIVLVQLSGTSSVVGTGFAGSLALGETAVYMWDGLAWGVLLTNGAGGGGGGAVASVFGRSGIVAALTGDYTAAQVTNAFDLVNQTTDDITEGVSNLFYTEAKVDTNPNVAANTIHRTSNGTDHSDVVLNNNYRLTQHIPLSYMAVANGVATLGADGKVPSIQLPSLVITTVHVVADQAEQLALVVEEGDVAIRTDQGLSYVALNNNNASMSDWALLAGGAGVLTVNGDAGPNVVLTTSDITEGTNLYYTEARVALNTDVAANTAARHIHSNFAILELTEAGYTIAERLKLASLTPGGEPNVVTSVFTRTGDVIAQTNDYTWAQIDKATSSLEDIATRSAGALNTGNLNIGRMPAGGTWNLFSELEITGADLVFFGNTFDSVAIGGGGDNNYMVTKGYVDSAIAVSGGGNLGWYPTEAALILAHPTGANGQYAIIGETDTIWTWDSDTNAWVDTDKAPILVWEAVANVLKPVDPSDNTILLEAGIANKTGTYSATEMLLRHDVGPSIQAITGVDMYSLYLGYSEVVPRGFKIYETSGSHLTIDGYGTYHNKLPSFFINNVSFNSGLASDKSFTIMGLTGTAFKHDAAANQISGDFFWLDDNSNNFIGIGSGSRPSNLTTGALRNTAIGLDALSLLTTGDDNIAIGQRALSKVTTGGRNVAVGVLAGDSMTIAQLNTLVGAYAGSELTSGLYNTCIGAYAGRGSVTSALNVMIGHQAGYYETGSNKLFIDNDDHIDEADARIKSMIYGEFNADVSLQNLFLNANVTLNSSEDKAALTIQPTGAIPLAIATTGYVQSYGIYAQTFDDADLVAGILVVTHNLDEKYVDVQLVDDTDLLVFPDNIKYISTSVLEIDLTNYAPLIGTYNLKVRR